jgi:hypothetical protein
MTTAAFAGGSCGRYARRPDCDQVLEFVDEVERGVSLILLVFVLKCPAGLDYDAVQFKRGSEMPKRPELGAIAEQVIARLKQIEDQVTQNQRIADGLTHLRDVVKDLERAIVSRFSGEPVPAPARARGNALPSAHALLRAPAPALARSRRAARTRPRSSQR